MLAALRLQALGCRELITTVAVQGVAGGTNCLSISYRNTVPGHRTGCASSDDLPGSFGMYCSRDSTFLLCVALLQLLALFCTHAGRAILSHSPIKTPMPGHPGDLTSPATASYHPNRMEAHSHPKRSGCLPRQAKHNKW